MSSGTIDALDIATPYPGVTRRELHGDGASLYWYAFEPGASFPLHRHHQEQITLVEEGTITMGIGPDGTRELSAGDWALTEGGLEHGITGGADGARIMIVLTPRRAVGETVEVLA
jgi:quercetin dioxygenase-like cupin family protein